MRCPYFRREFSILTPAMITQGLTYLLLCLCLCVSAVAAEKVAVLASGPHGNEYQGVDRRLGITLDSYKETPDEVQRLVKNLGSYRLILTTPLYKAKEAELAKQGAALRKFLENGGGILIDDANYAHLLEWLTAIDPALAIQTGGCDWKRTTACEPLSEIACQPNELLPLSFWGHMIVPKNSRWKVLFRCEHGHARMVFAAVGKGGIFMTSTRSQRLEMVENMLHFLTRNEAKPFLRPVVPKPLLQVQTSRSNGMLSTCRRLWEVEFPITITPDGKHDLRGMNVLLEVRNKQGQVVARSTDITGKATLDPALPAGKYSVKVALYSGKGQLQAEAETSVEILPPAPGQMLIDEDATLLWEGKPFFPLGVYHIPPKDYDRAADIGFNLLHVWSWDTVAALDKLEKKGIVGLWEQNNCSPKVIEENAGELRKHRALGMLYTRDEPPEEAFDATLEINSAWHKHVPDRLTYVVSYVPMNFEQNAQMGDILAVDQYPWPNKPLTEVSNFVDAARKATHGKKPIIFISQCFGKEPVREWRCMAFLALTHGAKGLLWFPWNQVDGATGSGMHKTPELQKAAKQLITELKAISPALTSAVPPRFFVESDGKLHGMVCFDPKQQRAYLLLVNSDSQPLSCTLEIPELDDSAKELKEAFSNHSIPAALRKVSLNLAPYATRIYSWNMKTILGVSASDSTPR